MARARRPVGRPTRGKTAPERLRRTDVLAALLHLPPSGYPLVVDVGYGADPTTTIETWSRLRTHRPALRVLGVEIDRARVDAAKPFERPGRLEFRVGGFDLPLTADEQPGLIRALNVLRQYPESEYDDAVRRMTRTLAPGGVLVEGTSSPTGRLLTANLWGGATAGVPVHHGVVLSVNLRRPWEPRELQTVLPKNFIHHAAPGSPLDDFFAAWERAVEIERRGRSTPRAVFGAAARRLADAGHRVDRRPALLARGFLLVRW